MPDPLLATRPPDLKTRIVYIGLTTVFIAEFGEFVWQKVWHVIQPVAAFVQQLIPLHLPPIQ